MNNPLESLDKAQLHITGLYKEVSYYLESESRNSFVIYACDARVLFLFAQGNNFIYHPYLEATKILPDGRPVYWLAKSVTNTLFEQVTGPLFMINILNDETLKRKRHMFYGGQARTIELLKLRCKSDGVNLVYAESPPLLGIDDLDVSAVNDKINEFEVDFFWCGLGAPKQEYLIYQLDRNRKVIMSGVGLGFDYYAGTVKKAPSFLSSLGLEWVVRYIQQPRRIVRFVRPFFFVLKLLVIRSIRIGKPH